jgi:2-(1,2-epoxy-1,2-dihydrophenyl)acetyl-CoA isomerase
MQQATNLNAKTAFLDYLDRVSENDSIKIVLILSSPNKPGRNEYIEFFNLVIQSKLNISDIHKMFNAVDQFILKIREMNQIVIHADSGKVLPLFLNISLACDYRIVADNTVFQNPCLEFDLAPKGGGAFFLSRILGVSRAYKIMLSEEDITAHEALKLRLVDEVAPFDELRDAAFKTAEQFARKPARSLRCCKRLLNYSLKDLREYLEFETKELVNLIGPHRNGLAQDAH